ncbi:MAG: SpoIID/LytB domain-containing protein [Acidaminococcaceae bacterium]|nr:SpoIID/LytB domain-containing protein [Acidaminococcaceae bacterium]
MKTLKLFLICVMFAVPISVKAEMLRVNLVRDQQSVQIEAEFEFHVQNVYSGNTTAFPAGRYYLSVRGGNLYLDDTQLGDKIEITRKEGGALPKINQKRYNGRFSAVAMAGQVYLNNEVDLEFFLTSVLPGKSSPIWPDEAIKAQAIAARSYAKYMKLLNKSKLYDIRADDDELPFTGLGNEKMVISKMVQATAGQYLLDRDGMPAMAVTTNCTGGRTESAAEVFGVAYSYLQSVQDYDQDAPDSKWTYDVSPGVVQNLIEQTGEVITGKFRSIHLSPINEPGDDRTPTGRVKSILIRGEDGIARVNADTLVSQLELKSNLFDIETGVPLPDKVVAPIENYYGMEVGRKELPINWGGERPHTWQGMSKSTHILKGTKEEKITFRGRGKGHGVGLSVWGARGMANKKFSCAEILAHYYPNTKLVK